MAFGRKKPRVDSTTAVSGVGPAPAVVKSPRASRKPKPAPELAPEIVAEIDAYHADPSDVVEETPPTRRPADHDDEW
jgi:hypothetical protein